eukprot:COSAG03_NODE_12761_length_532_cov_1.062356_1_plen_61_part_10
MHPVLEALQTLASARTQENEQLAPTVAVALDDGEQPLPAFFVEATPLLDEDGLRFAVLRTL